MKNVSLGIDVARLTFVAALWFGNGRFAKATFDNQVGGFRKLRRWLQAHNAGHVRCALESTNTYGEALAEWLYKEGHAVHILNPERTACYARSVGQRNKTDPVDAVMIARFISVHACTPWRPPAPEQKILRSLTRTRHQLVEYSKQLRNQLKTADVTAQRYLQATLEAIRQQLGAIVRAIGQHLEAHPVLGEQVRRMMTLKGVGLVTAAVTLAELPPITPDTDPRAICAWAGLTPRRWQSGKTEWRTCLSRKGNVYLRQALYMPALVAKRHNPLLHAFAQQLAAKGKTSGAILGAISHKMLRILVGLLRTNTDFNPNYSLQKN
jgi:transposase